MTTTVAYAARSREQSTTERHSQLTRWLARPRLVVAMVLLLATVLVAVPAGRRPFWSSDEARPALLARDILEHGSWLVPTLRERLYLNKPQLYFWSIAVLSLPFGRVTEATAVLPSVVSALLAAAGVVAIGHLAWGWRAGAVAALVMATIPHYFDVAHSVLPDVMLNAWMIWALYFLLAADRAGWRRWPLAAFYGCVAAAILTKGPAGFASLAAAVAAIGATRGLRALRCLRPLLGLAIVGPAVLLWLLPYQTQSGGAFAGQVVGGHYFTWFFHGDALPRLGHMALVFGSFLPWTVFLLGAALWWRRSPDDLRRRQIAIWTAAVWILVGISGTFRTRYLLPVYPGLALLTAEFIACSGARAERPLRRTTAISAALLALACAAAVLSPLVQYVAGENLPYVPRPGWERALVAALAALGSLALILGVRRDAFTGGAAAFGVALAGILVVIGIGYPSRYTAAYDIRRLAAVASAHSGPDGVVIAHPDLRLSYDFYLRRRVLEVAAPDVIARRLADGSSRDVVITSSDRWNALAPRVPAGWRPLERTVVAGREMLVIGNVER